MKLLIALLFAASCNAVCVAAHPVCVAPHVSVAPHVTIVPHVSEPVVAHPSAAHEAVEPSTYVARPVIVPHLGSNGQTDSSESSGDQKPGELPTLPLRVLLWTLMCIPAFAVLCIVVALVRDRGDELGEGLVRCFVVCIAVTILLVPNLLWYQSVRNVLAGEAAEIAVEK